MPRKFKMFAKYASEMTKQSYSKLKGRLKFEQKTTKYEDMNMRITTESIFHVLSPVRFRAIEYYHSSCSDTLRWHSDGITQ